MGGRFYHLAQINLLLVRAPLNDPIMAGFVQRLGEINQLGDRSPGFVWRLQDADSSNATPINPLDNERILINYTVWEAPEALKDYVYQSAHGELIRARKQWAEPPGKPSLAMWWTPAGHIPPLDGALERIRYLQVHGPGPFAFDFRSLRPPPAAPNAPGDSGAAPPLSYDGRVFLTVSNSDGGEVSEATTFRYGQRGSRVWAAYSGGGVRFGTLVAVSDDEGRLDAAYQHLGPSGFRAGACSSTPEVLSDGRLRLTEQWRWTDGATGSGVSVVEEA